MARWYCLGTTNRVIVDGYVGCHVLRQETARGSVWPLAARRDHFRLSLDGTGFYRTLWPHCCGCDRGGLGPAAGSQPGARPPAGRPSGWTDPTATSARATSFAGTSRARSTRFGGEGEVAVADGRIEMAFGYSLTGITYQNVFPKLDYELELEAIKIDGNDFFCGLTFPVDQSYCSLIVGGWGGAVVGISSIDGKDASQNNTTRYMRFEHGQWYRIRLRVTAARLRAWIDDQLVVDQPIQGRRITTRSEVNLSQPFGICAYETRAAFRDIRVRRLNATEIRESEGASASGM